MKQISMLLLCLSIALGVCAQSRIDRVIEDLEKKQDVETTYSERRTPKKHKLYRITTVLKFSKPEYYKRLAKAFEEEREHAISAVKTDGGKHSYRFINDKGSSTYTLTKDSVVKSWRSVEDNEDDDSSIDIGGETIIDTYISNTSGIVCRQSSRRAMERQRREMAKYQRELAKRQREFAREQTKRQRELAKHQRELARHQRELAEHQKELARKKAELARKELGDTQIIDSYGCMVSDI